ncbi:Lon protease family protein [Vibrio gazogenes]|uniref:endopeptidase La n=1 Tax=Vibrio gazogenes DSM 21264 = NBRC 103151 TaxID=1123492 RepID=A0A1M4ZL75_VIBGA|nr:Lon protease family protein [Vibrio gazogenes]USP15178.1 Lon protease family protein [Vibrio gazogenes]SHF18793.1 Lon-like ATP-dependent protease [Vibrio gazogenes DSM 21264] [Vibrio gazogenes DSM 21264 = NBRC 103151]
MTNDIWRLVTPQFDDYSTQFAQYPSIQPADFMSTQPRLQSTLRRFTELTGLSRLLIIHAPDNSVYRHIIQNSLSALLPENIPVITSESLEKKYMFTTVKADNGHLVSEISGLLDKADGGYLIISPNWLIKNAASWPILKSVLLGEEVSALNCDEKSPLQYEWTKRYDIKLILSGDREQLATVDYIDDDIRSGLSLYTEIELEMKIEPDTLAHYFAYLKWLLQTYCYPDLAEDAVRLLLTAGVRQTEDQQYIPLCLFWHRTLLEEATIEAGNSTIESHHIQSALDKRYYRESYLPERALSDILNGQVLIETQGKQVGQVNGLTVIDIAGHPFSYGEPARISCVVHFGDGDISDVERKVDLGGNLHAKGMMIMQAFVSSALELNAPLPYSASVVFEQSYSEVDGDSASLAEVCSLVSALSNIAIDQQIAVTGAVDQFGRVQAVGGLNEKIEGFYHVCCHQGLTGKQGVVLPKTNLRNLALHHTLVSSIQAGEFHIWPVSTVDEAIPILMGKPFRRKDTDAALSKDSGFEKNSVLEKIAERIELFEREENPESLWEKLKNRLNFY